MTTERHPSPGERPGLSRRRVLFSGAALVAVAALGSVGLLLRRSAALRPAAVPAADADPALVRLGRLYLGRHAEEAGRERLLELLALPRDPGADLESAGPAIAARVREDAAQDRYVLLDGWLVTRSEARLIALAAA